MGLEVKVEGLTPVKTKVNWSAPFDELNGILVEINDRIIVVEQVWTDRRSFIGRILYSPEFSTVGDVHAFKCVGDGDVYYLEGQWSAFYKFIRGEEEKEVSNEIDWNVRNQLLICKVSGSIVLYERLVNKNNFGGLIIYKASDTGYNAGHIYDQFAKNLFKPFRGTVILTQK